jgi:hypothetical protein
MERSLRLFAFASCGLLLLSSGVFGSAPARATTARLARPANSPWAIQQRYPLPIRLNGISCASGSYCLAVGDGPVVVATRDGGNTWRRQTLPRGTEYFLYC